MERNYYLIQSDNLEPILMNSDQRDKLLYTDALLVFKKLKKHIGEEITVDSISYGSLSKVTDTLKDVNNFEYITTERYSLPFISDDYAIISITDAETGEKIYYNPHIPTTHYQSNSEAKTTLRQLSWGSKIAKKLYEDQLPAKTKTKSKR